MRIEIALVADVMIPEAALPYSSLTLRDFGSAARADPTDRLGEARLDFLPPHRKIGITCRQRPNAVQMIRQDDPGVDVERQISTRGPSR